jgi:hypothetical protein
MSNILFTRDFNSDTLGTTPADLAIHGETPDTVPWQIATSGPNALYTKSLRVTDYTGSLCVALFAADTPADSNTSESLALFKVNANGILTGVQYKSNNMFVNGGVEGTTEEIQEWWADFGIPLQTASISALNSSYWYLMRFRMYNTVGCKVKVWRYGTTEPTNWDLTSTEYRANSQPGINLCILGGTIDFAYLSVGYGSGNAPQMPSEPQVLARTSQSEIIIGASDSINVIEAIDRTCKASFVLASDYSQSISQYSVNRKCSSALALQSGNGQTITHQIFNRTCTSGFTFTLDEGRNREVARSNPETLSFSARARTWKPYGLTHLSFTATSKLFTFHATTKCFTYNANPGRTL